MLVHRLHVRRHAVKAVGQGAELVASDARYPGRKITLLYPIDRLGQHGDGFEHKAVAGIHKNPGRHDGKCHHGELRQVQRRRPARHAGLDSADERVDVVDKGRGIALQFGAARRVPMDPLRAEGPPVGQHRRKMRSQHGVPRHEQRPLGVAVLE